MAIGMITASIYCPHFLNALPLMSPINFKVLNKNYFYLIAGFSIVIILVSILLALYTFTDNYRSLSYLDKAYGINARIDRISSIMKDAANQQHAYLITNKSSFLNTNNYVERDVNIEYSG